MCYCYICKHNSFLSATRMAPSVHSVVLHCQCHCVALLLLLLTCELPACVSPSSLAPADSLSPSVPCGVCFGDGDCYDFAALSSSDLLLTQIQLFSVRLCGFVSPKNCPYISNSTSVCMSSVVPPLASYSFAVYSPVTSSWSRLFSGLGNGVQLTMTGGVPCTDGQPRPINVQLMCSWREGLVGVTGNGCEYNLTVLTPLACASSSSTGVRATASTSSSATSTTSHSSIPSTALPTSTTSTALPSSTSNTAPPSSMLSTASPSSTLSTAPATSTTSMARPTSTVSTALHSSTTSMASSSSTGASTGEGNCGALVDQLEEKVRSLQAMTVALAMLVLALCAALTAALLARKAEGRWIAAAPAPMSVSASNFGQSAYQQFQG